MNFWDYIDWEKLHTISYEKAFEESFKLFFDGKLKEEEIGTYVKLAHKKFADELWLTGPLPMKEGWKPPTFDLSFYDDKGIK